MIIFLGRRIDLLGKLFDISKFDSYKEDNRREVKKATGGLPVSYGIPTLHLPIVMVG